MLQAQGTHTSTAYKKPGLHLLLPHSLKSMTQKFVLPHWLPCRCTFQLAGCPRLNVTWVPCHCPPPFASNQKNKHYLSRFQGYRPRATDVIIKSKLLSVWLSSWYQPLLTSEHVHNTIHEFYLENHQITISWKNVLIASVSSYKLTFDAFHVDIYTRVKILIFYICPVLFVSHNLKLEWVVSVLQVISAEIIQILINWLHDHFRKLVRWFKNIKLSLLLSFIRGGHLSHQVDAVFEQNQCLRKLKYLWKQLIDIETVCLWFK